jgi:hypothetical protein
MIKTNKPGNHDLKWFLIKLNLNKIVQRELILICLEVGSAIMLITKLILNFSQIALEDVIDIVALLLKGSCFLLSWAWIKIKTLENVRLF